MNQAYDLRELLDEFAEQRRVRSTVPERFLCVLGAVAVASIGQLSTSAHPLVALLITLWVLIASACYFRWTWVCGLVVIAAFASVSADAVWTLDSGLDAICRLGIYASATVPTLLFRAALRRALSISEHDRLTGLYNRTGFLKRLESESNRAARSGWPIAVGFLDCDDFKLVNDKFGHLAGDEVLRLTSGIIAENIRNYDAAARFGGDEFVMLWPVLSAAGGEDAARRLHEILTRRMEEAGWPVTFSLGVAVFETIPETDTILGRADALMYDVKRDGKGGLKVQVFRDESKLEVG